MFRLNAVPMTNFNRRSFLKALAFCLSSPTLFLGGCASQPLLPEPSETKSISFEEFMALSELITRTQDLDATVSLKIYRAFINEQWGPQNLLKIYIRIRDLQNNSDNEISFLNKDIFTDSEQWFISHLLMTWYTGVYFHSSGNRHVTLKHALMYRKLESYRGIKTYCGGEYGHWAIAPEEKT